MRRFAHHEQRDHCQYDCTGETAKNPDFPGPESELRVGGMLAGEIVGHGGNKKRDHMSAHVPAIGQ